MNRIVEESIIQLIQSYYELDQFLVFIEQNLSLLKTLENRYLTNNQDDLDTRHFYLERIQKDFFSQLEFPDFIRSSISTWDGIVTNRGLFLDVRKRFNFYQIFVNLNLDFWSIHRWTMNEFYQLFKNERIQSNAKLIIKFNHHLIWLIVYYVNLVVN